MREDATGVDDSGVPVDSRILTELSIVTYVKLDKPRVGSIYVGPRLLSVTVVDEDGPIASVTTLKTSKLTDIRMESLRKCVFCRVSFGDMTGVLANHTFSTYEQSGIHEFCVLPIENSCVTGIIDDKTDSMYTGDLELRFDNGVVCSVFADTTGMPVINMAVSDSLARALSSGCTPMNLNSACVAPVIQTINGIPPNEFGEIALVLE